MKESSLLLSPVSAMREELERAQLQDKQSHTTAWHNLSEVRRALGMETVAPRAAFPSKSTQKNAFHQVGDGHGLASSFLLSFSS